MRQLRKCVCDRSGLIQAFYYSRSWPLDFLNNIVTGCWHSNDCDTAACDHRITGFRHPLWNSFQIAFEGWHPFRPDLGGRGNTRSRSKLSCIQISGYEDMRMRGNEGDEMWWMGLG